MKGRIILMVALVIFAVSVSASSHSEQALDSRIDIEESSEEEASRLEAPIRDVKVSEVSENLRANSEGGTRCVVLGSELVCFGDGSLEHTDDWVASRLVGEPEFWQNQSRLPTSVAVVLEEGNCPRDQACYRMNTSTIDITVVNDRSVPGANPSNGVQWPYNLTGQYAMAVVEYGSSTSERAAYPPIGIPINASVPKGTVYSEPPAADCDDQDTDVRPSDSDRRSDGDGRVCGMTTHFLDPDSDGDGFGDLKVVQADERFEWNLNNETVGYADLEVLSSATGHVIILNVEEAQSRPELVEAIASNSGLSKADSKKALDAFIYITVEAAYKELDKSTPYIYQGRSTPSDELDKATPELNESVGNEKELRGRIAELGAELAVKENHIDELESRLRELEGEVSESDTSKQGDDSVVRKRPGEAAEGDDADSDADGLGDAEEETDELVKRPGFVARLLGSIFR